MHKIYISGFPGVGKSFLTTKYPEIADSDSSKFAKDNFPINYIEYITSNKVHVQLISSHKSVREELQKRNINYYLVYPDITLKEEYIKRYINRDSATDFILFIQDNWELFIKEIEEETFPELVKLEAGQYLSDIVLRTYLINPYKNYRPQIII